MLTRYLEKNAFYPGAIAVTASSNSWRVMQDTTIVRTDFVLATGAAGAGSTVVNVIKNGDALDIVATATFAEGGNLVQIDSSEIELAAGDTLQVVVPTIAATPGEDLLVQFLYFPR